MGGILGGGSGGIFGNLLKTVLPIAASAFLGPIGGIAASAITGGMGGSGGGAQDSFDANPLKDFSKLLGM